MPADVAERDPPVAGLEDHLVARRQVVAPRDEDVEGQHGQDQVRPRQAPPALEPGERSPESILKGLKAGLYVTELIGGEANTVTGDYSSGAAGLWIENGELAYPVSEITIAGNLKQMLLDVEIGSDLEFRGSIASPTLLIREMTISGQ